MSTCKCKRPLINLQGCCTRCGLERIHVVAKVPMVSTYIPPDEDAA